MRSFSHLHNKKLWELEQRLEYWREVAKRLPRRAYVTPWAVEYVEAYEEELLVRRLLRWATQREGVKQYDEMDDAVESGGATEKVH